MGIKVLYFLRFVVLINDQIKNQKAGWPRQPRAEIRIGNERTPKSQLAATGVQESEHCRHQHRIVPSLARRRGAMLMRLS